MSNGYLTSVAFVIALLITSMLLLKKSVDNIETKTFKKMLIFNILEALTTTSIVIVATTINSTPILKLLNRIDVILIIMWCSSMFYYIYAITSKSISKLFNKATLLFNIILIILSLILNVEIIVDNGVLNSTGALTYLGLLGAVIYIILMILTLTIVEDKKENIEKGKYLPLYFLIGMLILVAILRIIIPEINFISIVISLVDLIMIFTIENPDIKLVKQLNLYIEQNKKLTREQIDILTNLSHEIRTPLNAVIGFSELIETSKTLKEAKTNAKDIIESADKLLKLVNNIVDVSKLNTDDIKIENNEYDIEKLIDDCLSPYDFIINEKKLKVYIDIDKELPKTLIGDSIKIKRILFNLIDNAIKYTNKGYIKISVKGKTNKSTCNLEIIVEDSGKGIDKELKNNLFKNYIRSKEDINGTISGMGLGLSLTKSLIEVLNGSIEIESKEDIGTKVIINLKQKVGK